MTTSDLYTFEHFAALAFFASAYADQADEAGCPLRGQIMDVLPDQTDLAAIEAGLRLQCLMEKMNGKSVFEMLEWIVTVADGDRPATMEMFGHYCAMQAMGHGVGLYDAFGKKVYDTIQVPHMEFSSLDIEEYFPFTDEGDEQ